MIENVLACCYGLVVSWFGFYLIMGYDAAINPQIVACSISYIGGILVLACVIKIQE